jgi:peptidoglycan/LPS O-acetylase OafA/YrhL
MLAALIATAMLPQTTPASASAITSAQALLAAGCMLVTIVAKPTGVFLFLNSRPIVTLGVLSYSLYVWHMLFVKDYMKLSDGGLLWDWKFWVFPALALSACSFYFFERPLLGLRKRFKR